MPKRRQRSNKRKLSIQRSPFGVTGRLVRPTRNRRKRKR